MPLAEVLDRSVIIVHSVVSTQNSKPQPNLAGVVWPVPAGANAAITGESTEHERAIPVAQAAAASIKPKPKRIRSTTFPQRNGLNLDPSESLALQIIDHSSRLILTPPRTAVSS